MATIQHRPAVQALIDRVLHPGRLLLLLLLFPLLEVLLSLLRLLATKLLHQLLTPRPLQCEISRINLEQSLLGKQWIGRT